MIEEINKKRRHLLEACDFLRTILGLKLLRKTNETSKVKENDRAGHFLYFLIFSLIKNDFFHFLSS